MKTTHRIGLFGGTFDPIHNGHVRVACEVRQRLDLETLFFIPAAVPPHKPGHAKPIADAAHRLEMIRNAIAVHDGLAVCDVELKRSGPSYTIDTIRAFTERKVASGEGIFIVGMDAFLEIDTWMSHKTLFDLVAFAVMSRPGIRDSDAGALESFVREKIDGRYRLSGDRRMLRHPEKRPILLLDVSPVDVSSSRIRKRLRQGRPITGLVPVSVAQYINDRGLYR